MRIGIVPQLRRSFGGVYQYSITVLHALAHYDALGGTYDFVVLTNDREHSGLPDLNLDAWSVEPLRPPSVRRLAKRVLARAGLAGVVRRIRERMPTGATPIPNVDVVRSRPKEARRLNRLGIELMLYPEPNTLAFETPIPSIMAVHDLHHRLYPEFPEVSADGEWERREYLFRNAARNATVLLTDSEVGKEDILDVYGHYGVTPERVRVLPFVPAAYLPAHVSETERDRVRRAFNLPDRYLLYPAQFWPHKNHRRIVQALALLRRESGITAPIVFSGSSDGKILQETFAQVRSEARVGGIEDDVICVGYAPDADMGPLYAMATALVMPTLFGATCIPIVEAWAFGCPVITSDIRGIREQVGDAAMLVDPTSIEAIATAILQVWINEGLREDLIERGRCRLARYTPEDFRSRLIEAIEYAAAQVPANGRAYGTHRTYR
jgi:glycosyltransferase involved in cell wall biosynthesis